MGLHPATHQRQHGKDGGRERRWWRVRGNWLWFLAVTNSICACVLFRWFIFLLLAIFLLKKQTYIPQQTTWVQCKRRAVEGAISYFSLLFLKKKIVFWYCCCLGPMCTEIKTNIHFWVVFDSSLRILMCTYTPTYLCMHILLIFTKCCAAKYRT